MLTFISIPKPFVGHTAVIQNNAIASWNRIVPKPEIILFGDDRGVAEGAAKHEAIHCGSVACNAKGVPLVNDVIEKADRMARNDIICFVNSDIILFNDIMRALSITASRMKRYLIVSSRFDLQIDEPLRFDHGWEAELRDRARREGSMYPAAGSDVFIYRKGLFTALPPVAIGRGYWDNLLMRMALDAGANLVDATAVLTALHQRHDYAHIEDLSATTSGPMPYSQSIEVAENLKLIGGPASVMTNYDATLVLREDGRLISLPHPIVAGRRLKAGVRRLLQVIGLR